MLATYLTISLAYSFVLKNYPVIDLFCISSGFIIRLMAGGALFSVTVSEWLFLSVLLLSLFLSSGKRLGEKSMLGNSAGKHRKVLLAYPDGYLEGILLLTGSAVLVTYSMYVVNRHSLLLLATVPLCCFGLMRYIFRVKSGDGGDPTESLTKDIPLLLTGILWASMIGWGIYGG
jgi:4-hydroxybenzoate polyprenyltransferase